MTTIVKNQYKLLALASVIWLPIIVFLLPAMNTVIFVFVMLLGIWFSKGSVEVSYYYKENFEQEQMTFQQLAIAAVLVPFWFWLLSYKKPY